MLLEIRGESCPIPKAILPDLLFPCLPSSPKTKTPLSDTLVNIRDWCQNDFEFVQQLGIDTDYSHYRYDVLPLINGSPVVQVELKTQGVSPHRALEQTVDYKADPGNGHTSTLPCFVERFIVSNRTEAFYSANKHKVVHVLTVVGAANGGR